MSIANLKNGNMIVHENYEWKPIHDFVMIEIVPNDFKSKKTSSGLVLPDQPTERNESAGQVGDVDLRIILAKVVETGPECKFLKVGDYVYADKLSSRPIPLMENKYRVMPERNILIMGSEIKNENNDIGE